MTESTQSMYTLFLAFVKFLFSKVRWVDGKGRGS